MGNASIVADINTAGSAFDSSASFFQNGNTVFFSATVAGGNTGLWKIDFSGTPALVKNITGSISLNLTDCAALGTKTVFTVRSGDIFTGSGQLWVTDGTAGGTSLLKDFGFGSSSMFAQLTPYNGVLFFDGFDLLGKGIELWTTDGTAANTKLFKDIEPGNGSSVPLLITSAVLNGKLYFNATTAAKGSELWVTDGNAANTVLFKDINTTGGGKNSASPIFLANIGTFANRANGTNFNLQQEFSTTFNGKLFFYADDGIHGTELWSTDGTSGNTQIVKDINTGGGDGTAFFNGAYYTTTGIYFTADNGTAGTEPYVTDGTDGGTQQVANINPQANAGSNPNYMFIYNSQLYFNANNGDNINGDIDLYKIDKLLTVLPVNLLSFNAVWNAGSVSLSWTTASETNTSRFEIERSTDAVHFNEAGTIAATGNSAVNHTYQFNDAGALQTGASVIYYRLHIIDKDGKSAYTATLPVQLQGGKFTITLSPNPVHNQLVVAFSTGNAKNITLLVTDANGKPVYKQQFGVNGLSAMQQHIDVARYAAGTYFVQLITDKETKTAKFIKQ